MNTCHISKIPLALALMLALPACTLLGVESEDLDVVDTGDEEMSTMSSMGGETSGGEESDSDSSATGTDTDTDSDSASGDGDGDPATGDGDGDPTGDGDGDPGSTGDGDGDSTGDGDGDSTGDGDGDGASCEELSQGELMVGDNPISVAMGPSLINGDCGSDGPESVYSYTATSDGVHTFTLLESDEFIGALYAAEDECVPLGLNICELEGTPLLFDLVADQVVYLVVDVDVPANGIIDVATP